MAKLKSQNIKEKIYHLYILECVDKTLYSGITTDINRRLKQHNFTTLGAKYTRARRPLKLVYSKKYKNRSVATSAEAKIKKLSRVQKLELIKK